MRTRPPPPARADARCASRAQKEKLPPSSFLRTVRRPPRAGGLSLPSAQRPDSAALRTFCAPRSEGHRLAVQKFLPRQKKQQSEVATPPRLPFITAPFPLTPSHALVVADHCHSTVLLCRLSPPSPRSITSRGSSQPAAKPGGKLHRGWSSKSVHFQVGIQPTL